MPHLYLVRHAQPDFTGHYDSVTALGLQQSAWLGQHFAARGLRFARVACGNLQRQVHTLDTALAHLPEARRPWWIRGSTSTTRRASYPHFTAATNARCDPLATGAAISRRARRLQAWSRQEEAPAGTESWRAFGERVVAAADGDARAWSRRRWCWSSLRAA